MASTQEQGEWPKTAVNKIKRSPNRGAYDPLTINTIVNTAPILHVSFIDPAHPFPVVLPMLGCVGNFTTPDAPLSEVQDVYIHGYVSGRMFRLSKNAGSSDAQNAKGGAEQEEGLPMTISAALMDGIVLALTPFHNSCNYRSATIYGHAALVTDADERMYAMKLITDNVLPGRWDNSRLPPTKSELDSTSILKLRISSASAKVRVGGPSEERADLKDSELVERVWTGVVPCWLQYGEPVPGRECGVKGGEVEGYIEKWRLEENRRGKGGAYEAVEKEG